MAGIGWSTTYANKIINHFLRNVSQTPDATIYAALFTVAPADDGTGGTEVSAGDYSRKAVTFSAASGGATANTGSLDFVGSAASAWGTLVFIGLYNASTSGTYIGGGPISPALVVGIGSPVSVAIGQLSSTQE